MSKQEPNDHDPSDEEKQENKSKKAQVFPEKRFLGFLKYGGGSFSVSILMLLAAEGAQYIVDSPPVIVCVDYLIPGVAIVNSVVGWALLISDIKKNK